MAKQLLYTDDARKKLLAGAEKLSRAVGITLGPTGITLKCGPSSIELTPVGVTIKGLEVVVNGTAMTNISAPLIQIG